MLNTCRAGFRRLTHCRNKLQTEETVCTSLQTCFIQRGSLFAGKISSAQLRNPPQCPSMRHIGARAHAHTHRVPFLFTQSGSAYLIVKARHGLRHLSQNNINGRRTHITVTHIGYMFKRSCTQTRASIRACRSSLLYTHLSTHTYTHIDTHAQYVSTVKVAELHVKAF